MRRGCWVRFRKRRTSRGSCTGPLCATSRHMQCGKTALLFDHLVGAGEQRRRVKPKRLGGLEVDRQFELGRLLHRKVGRLLAFKDAIDVASSAPELVDEIRPVGHQAAAGCEETV